MKNYKLTECSKDDLNDKKKLIVFEFNLNPSPDKLLGSEEIKGHFPLFMHPSDYPKIDNGQIKKTDKEIIQWMLDIGLCEKGSQYHSDQIKAKLAAVMVAFTCPGIKLENAGLYLHFTVLAAFYDDTLDNQALRSRYPGQEGYELLKKANDIFIEVLEGKIDNIEHVPNLDFPSFKALCRGFLALRQEAVSTNMDISYFVDGMRDYLRFTALNYHDYEPNVFPFKDAYLFSRPYGLGMYPVMEITNLILKISLSPQLRRDPLFKLIMHFSIMHTGYVNDILSLKREMSHQDVNNIVLIRHQKLPLKEAVNKCLKKIDEIFNYIKTLSDKLLQNFPNEADLPKFLMATMQMLDGQFYFYQHTKRYGEIKYSLHVIEYENGEQQTKTALITHNAPKMPVQYSYYHPLGLFKSSKQPDVLTDQISSNKWNVRAKL